MCDKLVSIYCFTLCLVVLFHLTTGHIKTIISSYLFSLLIFRILRTIQMTLVTIIRTAVKLSCF